MATGDHDFLVDFGAEVLFETSRFWVSRVAATTPRRDTYSLKQVMGPDEFHSHVDNNAFTNRLAQWHLEQSVRLYEDLAARQPPRRSAVDRDGDQARPSRGVSIGKRLSRESPFPPDPHSECLVEQFEGYFQPRTYPSRSAGCQNYSFLSATRRATTTSTVKTTMLFEAARCGDAYVHVAGRLQPTEVKRANFEFYEARTLHKLFPESCYPRDHGHRGGRLHSGAAVLLPLGAGRSDGQPGQYRVRHAHSLGRRHLADSGERVRRRAGSPRSTDRQPVATGRVAGDSLPAALARPPRPRRRSTAATSSCCSVAPTAGPRRSR